MPRCNDDHESSRVSQTACSCPSDASICVSGRLWTRDRRRRFERVVSSSVDTKEAVSVGRRALGLRTAATVTLFSRSSCWTQIATAARGSRTRRACNIRAAPAPGDAVSRSPVWRSMAHFGGRLLAVYEDSRPAVVVAPAG